jgi:hypothetical protein
MLAANGAIIPKLHSGEVTSTEVDLSELSDEERIESYEYILMLNNWAAPDYSKLDSDTVYSEKQQGNYRCNFRKAKHVLEFENELNRQFEGLVKNMNKRPWYTYLLKLIIDNFALSILVVVLSFLGLGYLIDIKELWSSLFMIN